ncbi:MAG: type II toxin-antitoxin system VapC family toxin [Gammaproteobacteria bacterium]|nr:type II toxin-antitoxin system VapC family toxin [Gammaproteobacteria bacterium]
MQIDTDVLIWLFRGRNSAQRAIDKCQSVELSAITYMELVQGMRNKEEFRLLRQTIHECEWEILPLNENISHRATVYIENYALSHGLQLADALIVASAVECGSALMTANVKHYKVIPEVELARYRP